MTLENSLAGLVEKSEHRFWGKYRGTVVDNEDPQRLGRLKVNVTSVLGRSVVTGWAMPCVPFGGAADQGFLFVPDRGAGVWVEFEEGDLEFPVWVGTWWSIPAADSQVPRPQRPDGTETDQVQSPPTCKIIRTAKGHTIQFEDADGAEMLLLREGAQGHLLTMNADGITIVDKNQNTIVLTDDGIQITDATGNGIQMSGSAMTLTSVVPFTIDASGQPVSIVADSIDFAKG